MNDPSTLREEIRLEFSKLERTIEELESLAEDVGDESPTLREQAAASNFLRSVYMGVENVLIRIHKFSEKPLPEGERWHVELMERFVEPSASLPTLIDEPLARRLDAFRRFRHLAHHGYSLDLDWERMRDGLVDARPVFETFHERVEAYLSALDA